MTCMRDEIKDYLAAVDRIRFYLDLPDLGFAKSTEGQLIDDLAKVTLWLAEHQL